MGCDFRGHYSVWLCLPPEKMPEELDEEWLALSDFCGIVKDACVYIKASLPKNYDGGFFNVLDRRRMQVKPVCSAKECCTLAANWDIPVRSAAWISSTVISNPLWCPASRLRS